VLLSLVLILSACGSEPTTSTPGGSNTPGTTQQCPQTNGLTGAGATFPFPLYSKMFSEYAKAGCKVQVNYQSVGSGAGKTQFLQQTVDFGASDAPMSDDELGKSKAGAILHIPATLGAVAISYNLPSLGADTHLKFSGTLIADIFLGKVKSWDDPEIAKLNAGVTLPKKGITVVHRSDGSGTSAIFTNYLKVVSTEWKDKVGAGSTVNWPVGVGGKGNEGVASAVRTTEGSIGYNELAYVLANKIQHGMVQSKDGEYLLPTLETAKANAQNYASVPDDLRFYVVNSPGKDSYPITGYSWILVYEQQRDANQGQALANLLWWMVHDGQQYASTLSYVPLPANIVQKNEEKIKKMQCGGSPCYKG
jgi:phosphate transport system substrate-binding protein